MGREKQPISKEERAEWREAVADVTPLAAAVKLPLPGADADDASSLSRVRGRGGAGVSQKQEPSTNQFLPLTHPARGRGKSSHGDKTIERNMLHRIAKGREPIEARLDLHGMTEAEAYRQFSGFIHRAHDDGMRTVLVITGKGRGGEGRLRRALRHWLESEELRGGIGGCHAAHPTHGGDGAWYIRIRRKR